jgi:hypothetical protein
LRGSHQFHSPSSFIDAVKSTGWRELPDTNDRLDAWLG